MLVAERFVYSGSCLGFVGLEVSSPTDLVSTVEFLDEKELHLIEHILARLDRKKREKAEEEQEMREKGKENGKPGGSG